ncbi:membrane transporter, partial [Oryctes borbonicus]
VFKSEPPLPPTKAQADLRSNATESSSKFWKSYKSLCTDKDFLLLTISFGICIGVYVALCTMLNQIILEYFENAEKDAGLIGLLLVVVGMGGVLLFGVILDKTKKYKQTTVALYAMTILGVIAFMAALETRNKILVYISGCLLGFFQTAYYGVSFEFGVELSYPQPESTSTGILIVMVQILGIAFTLLLGQLLTNFGTFWALAMMVVFLVLGGIITVIIPNKLLRQEALKSSPEKKMFLPKTE